VNRDGLQTGDGILELIRDRLNIDVADVDVDMIETGVLDSIALVTLITAIEEALSCELPLDDFDIGNFRSARRIIQYLDALGVLDTRSAS
jgi:D-alanine--poly(phosphoribitol) ligase subunit 2